MKKDLQSVTRSSYIVFSAIFFYCCITIFFDKSEFITRNYSFFISHKIFVLGLCVFGIWCAKTKKWMNYLQDLMSVTCLIYVCLGELFYPGYNLAYIQMILIIPLIFSFSEKKTILHIVFSFTLFNIALFFGQSQYVKAVNYESFFLDVIISNISASCISFFLCKSVKKIREDKIKEMNAYYALGLQSFAFVHDAKTSLLHSYRNLKDEENSKPIFEEAMSNLKNLLDNPRTESCSLNQVYKEVVSKLAPYAKEITFSFEGEDLQIKMPEYYLKSVLSNLFSNSMRMFAEFSVSNPEIKLIVDKNGFSIEDNGRGFSEELINNLKKDRSPASRGFSTGLGIINSKKLLESFDGTLELENLAPGAKVRISF